MTAMLRKGVLALLAVVVSLAAAEAVIRLFGLFRPARSRVESHRPSAPLSAGGDPVRRLHPLSPGSRQGTSQARLLEQRHAGLGRPGEPVEAGMPDGRTYDLWS